ncbi:restriction endonuclease subunit S [Methanobrevibacter acididurans]|uniref:restriction endonuclease subunit S n=2 Tax=Methanobrevibacter TaxID=2172 RepID=UPI0038FCDEF7
MFFEKYKIKNVSEINIDNYSKKENWSFINYLDTKNITNNKIIEIKFLNPLTDKIPSRAKRKIKENDIIISTVRPNQKHYGIIEDKPTNLLVSTGFTTLRAKENYVLSKYLYYLITQDKVTKKLQTIAEQSTTSYPSIKTSDIENINIELPSIKIQKQIISIINSIEKQVIKLRKINQNLEQHLNVIFNEWYQNYNFYDERNKPYKDNGGNFKSSSLGEIPESWKIEKIGNLPLIITDYVANGSFASLKENVTLYEEPEYAFFIRNTDLKSNKFEKYVDQHSYEFLRKSFLRGNEVIISNVGDVGSVYLCPKLEKPMTLGNNMILIKSDKEKTDINWNYFIYLLFNSSYGQYLIESISGGSVQSKFNKTDFRSLKIVIPSESDLLKFNNFISPFFKYHSELTKEIKDLTSLRDILLPKLMSGEIDVSQIEVE